MTSIIEVKHHLCLLEKLQDWRRVCEYLFDEWVAQPDNAQLCTLVIQQSLSYLLAVDNGNSTELHCHNNNSPSNVAYYHDCLRQSLEYGLKNCISNKYFLWQICFYLTYFATYYPIAVAFSNTSIDEAKNKLLLYAEKLCPESIIFLPMILCCDVGTWLRQLTADERLHLDCELREFDLQQNREDMYVRSIFSLE